MKTANFYTQKIKWKFISTFGLALFTISFYACRKELLPTNLAEGAQASFSILQAKQHYSTLLAQQGNLVSQKGMAKTSDEAKPNHKYVTFEKAYMSENAESSFVEAPLTYDRKISLLFMAGIKLTGDEKKEILNGSFQRLIIAKDKKTGLIDQQIITYIPTLGYLRKSNNDISINYSDKLEAHYSGYIAYSKWDGTLLYLTEIKDGKAVKTFQKNAKIKKGMKVSYEECTEEYVEYYEMVCPYGGECYWSFYMQIG